MTKLGEITVNGKQVSVFKPPHDEPDFPWVDVEELARAYMPKGAAREIVKKTHRFGGDVRSCVTVKNGDRIATIICHAMAQGLCAMIDFTKGHRGEDEDGPCWREYALALGKFTASNYPMSLDQMVHAFKNPGGKFLRGVVDVNEP